MRNRNVDVEFSDRHASQLKWHLFSSWKFISFVVSLCAAYGCPAWRAVSRCNPPFHAMRFCKLADFACCGYLWDYISHPTNIPLLFLPLKK